MITPNYYEQFHCIGSECKHNCCKGGWEIEVDDDSLARFERIDGEFGKKIRSAINDENVFKHVDGHCPLLSDDGWCEMVKNGYKLCIICDEYPRFTEFYEEYSERGLSISCEVAAKIILNNTKKFLLIGESEKCTHPIFNLIFNSRNKVIEILQDRDKEIWQRLRLALDYTNELQKRINQNNYSDFVYIPSDNVEGHKNLIALLSLFYELDMLYPDWKGKLDAVYDREKKSPHHLADQMKVEQLIVYFVYRYFLKGAFDCDVISKMKFVAISVCMIVALENVFGDFEDCARFYSIEIEHDEDNMETIYDEFIFCEDFSYENIVKMIG